MRLRYDRGTILIDDPPPGLDVGSLPQTLWDPRVGAYRAPAGVLCRLRATLGALGIGFADAVMSAARPKAWREPDLRPYQDTALAAWRAAGGRGTVVLPTGSGKTRVALAAMARSGRATLVVVPTRVLLDQWHREVRRWYGGRAGYFGNGVRALEAITVCTYASADLHMARLGDRFELLVIDEVHNVTGGAYEDTFAMSAAPFRLGLTATPPRSDESRAILERIVGPCVYELSIGDLAGGFLAPFDLVRLLLDLTADERRRYDEDMGVFRPAYARFRAFAPQAEWTDFTRAAARSDEGRRALAAWRRARRLLAYTRAKDEAIGEILARHRDARLLLFTADNDSAYRIARRHLIMPITCHIRRPEREAALERFRRGELRALVSARVLNEGLDVPDADVAVVIGGWLGEREHVQRIGRLLRPAPGKRALVYELISRATTEVRQMRRRNLGLDTTITAQL